jgi:hypothetical protein
MVPLTLPALTTAGPATLSGVIDAPQLQSLQSLDVYDGQIQMPALASVAGEVHLYAGELDAAVLTDVGGDFVIEKVSGLDLPSLAQVTGTLRLDGFPLDTLELPSLRSALLLEFGVGASEFQCDSTWDGCDVSLVNINMPSFDTITTPGPYGIAFGCNPVFPACRAQALITQAQRQFPTDACPLASGPCP